MDIDEQEQQRRSDVAKRAGDGRAGQDALVNTMFELKDAVTEQSASSKALGGQIKWLNIWLLVFTVAIFLLTAAQVIASWPQILITLGFA